MEVEHEAMSSITGSQRTPTDLPEVNWAGEIVDERLEPRDAQRAVIEPPLPTDVRVLPRLDDRTELSGIVRRLRTGAPWPDIAERFGPPMTCMRWRKRSVWDRLFAALAKVLDGHLRLVDSSSARVHQHGADGRSRPTTPRWDARAAG
ncbi:transposase [Acuticoccus sp.]|uniref:transposase n=1 Tax=Acuticoccus sp. TaxID=1904378 RepID=UPI003B52C73F